MPKEKFDRSKPHINIGEIAKKHVELNANRKMTTDDALNSFKDSEQILQYLINQYGLEEGKKYFEFAKCEGFKMMLENQSFVYAVDAVDKEESINIIQRRR